MNIYTGLHCQSVDKLIPTPTVVEVEIVYVHAALNCNTINLIFATSQGQMPLYMCNMHKQWYWSLVSDRMGALIFYRKCMHMFMHPDSTGACLVPTVT